MKAAFHNKHLLSVNVVCITENTDISEILDKIQVNLRPSSDVTMKGGTFIVTNMTRLTSALVWVVMGTTCLGSEGTGQFQFHYYGRIRNERVVCSLSKKVQRSKHDAEVPPPPCSKLVLYGDSIKPSPSVSWGGIWSERRLIWSLEFYTPFGILHKWDQGLLNCQVTLWTKSALDLLLSLQQHYSPGWASASFKSFLHPSRFRATIVQVLHPSVAAPSFTPSSQRSLGLPQGRFPPGSLALLDKSSSSCRMTCPAHLNLLSLQNFTMSFSPHNW